MKSLFEAAKKVLSESPMLVAGNIQSTAAYEMMPHMIRYNDHIESGESIHVDGESTITHLAPTEKSHRYYLKRNSKGAVFSMRFGKTNIVPGNTGEYAAMIVKSPKNSGYEYPDMKRCYDHVLSNNDYLASDKHQMVGGMNTWIKLASDYHAAGKHLYVHDENGLNKVDPDWISSHSNDIWGEDDKHEKTRLLVSNKELV